MINILADSADTAISSTLIATAGTVIAAGIAAVAAAFHRSPPGNRDSPVLGLTQAYLDELVRRATSAETERDEQETEVDRLRHLLMEMHVNPDTGDKL